MIYFYIYIYIYIYMIYLYRYIYILCETLYATLDETFMQVGAARVVCGAFRSQGLESKARHVSLVEASLV